MRACPSRRPADGRVAVQVITNRAQTQESDRTGPWRARCVRGWVGFIVKIDDETVERVEARLLDLPVDWLDEAVQWVI